MPPTTQQPSRIAEHLKRPSPLTWLFIGDSITQGAVHTRGWRDYTQLFKERLGEIGRNEDVVINTAVGGWTIDAVASRFDERIARFNPHILFTMFGTNDAAGGADQLTPFKANYEKVLALAAEHQIHTVVQTSPPIFPVDPDRFGMMTYPDESVRQDKVQRLRTRQQFIDQYVEATRDVASRARVQLADHWVMWTKYAASRGQLTDGGFHPNEYGHRLIAHSMLKAIGLFDERSWTCRLFVPVDEPLC
jgi:lysophospholipase L1-like esterase